MKVLFIIDPVSSLKPQKDSSIAMMEAFSARACEIYICEYQNWFIHSPEIHVDAQKICLNLPLKDHLKTWYTLEGSNQHPVQDFDMVIVRKDPPFNLEYIYLTHFLDQIEKLGVAVLNTGSSLRNHPEKLSILEFPQFTPPTLVTANYSGLDTFLSEYKDIVVKPLDGMGGAGIFRITESDGNKGSIYEILTQQQTMPIMAQQYRSEIKQGDKRILIINGHVVPYCLARIPKEGEFRGNLAAGGRGVAQAISEENLVVAQFIADTLSKRGLFLIGLDMIGNLITEINVTSPTCFVEIFEQTGYNVASFFADEAIRHTKAMECLA